ncbi:MAG: DUF3467 domain-containing protein [Flavobacteriales bacterium]|jgi:hypothetical protein|nr:DUF3467 domain-containing protein [Flavobacteriales bacterium]
MSQENPGKKPKLNIELPDEVAPGVYSNLAVVTHSQTEFVLDFIQVMPGTPKAKVRSRVVLSPQHAKRVMKMLVDNIGKFEGQHGKIEMASQPEPSFPVNFGGPTGEA